MSKDLSKYLASKKSVLGLIFCFIGVISSAQVVMKLSPKENNIDAKLETFLSQKIKEQKVVEFAPGRYNLTKTINLPSNCIIRGETSENTILNFDLNGRGDCIRVSGNREKTTHELLIDYCTNSAFSQMYKVYNNNSKEVGLSDWGEESFGMLLFGKIENGKLLVNSEVDDIDKKILGDSVMCYRINPVENVLIKNLSIVRLDKTETQTSNTYFQFARECKVERVLSKSCNYSHITIDNSRNVDCIHNEFVGGFDHGNGGKSYGVTIQFDSGNCAIEANLFDSLRHGVVLQLGANNNEISENYFRNGYWYDVWLPKYSSGDIVLHGNYPFSNVIFGNVCNQIVVDNSHGLNGPNNSISHNHIKKYGFYMNRNSVDGKVIFSHNDLEKRGCLKGRITGKRKLSQQNNRINGKLRKPVVSEMIIEELPIGYPHDFEEYTNAAMEFFQIKD